MIISGISWNTGNSRSCIREITISLDTLRTCAEKYEFLEIIEILVFLRADILEIIVSLDASRTCSENEYFCNVLNFRKFSDLYTGNYNLAWYSTNMRGKVGISGISRISSFFHGRCRKPSCLWDIIVSLDILWTCGEKWEFLELPEIFVILRICNRDIGVSLDTLRTCSEGW